MHCETGSVTSVHYCYLQIAIAVHPSGKKLVKLVININ